MNGISANRSHSSDCSDYYYYYYFAVAECAVAGNSRRVFRPAVGDEPAGEVNLPSADLKGREHGNNASDRRDDERQDARRERERERERSDKSVSRMLLNVCARDDDVSETQSRSLCGGAGDRSGVQDGTLLMNTTTTTTRVTAVVYNTLCTVVEYTVDEERGIRADVLHFRATREFKDTSKPSTNLLLHPQ